MIRTALITSALLLSTLSLSACGFTPLHSAAGGGPAVSQLDVSVARGANSLSQKAGFFLSQELKDRTGTDAGRYRLDITPRYSRGRLGITDADIASRYDVTVLAQFTLTDTRTTKVIDKGSLSAFTTFGAPGDPYGVIVTDDNATRQAAQELADRLIERAAVSIAEAQKADGDAAATGS